MNYEVDNQVMHWAIRNPYQSIAITAHFRLIFYFDHFRMNTHFTLITFILFIIQNLNFPSMNSHSPELKLFLDCLKSSGVPTSSVITRESNASFYDKLNYQWNLRIPTIYPLAYFLPISSEQVQICVKCASGANIPVIPKSGGHSNEALSFGNSETIVIDFRFMDKIIADSVTQTAVIEAGALAGQISEKLWSSGGFGLPMGECLTVGIAGLTLGGGYGYLAHTYGLTIDSVLEVTMVDAQGSLNIVNKDKNPDLYWALRGVGSGYIGIVTNFKFKLFQASDLYVQVISVKYDLSRASEVLKSWQNWLNWTQTNAPNVMAELIFKSPSIFGNIVEVRNKTSNPKYPDLFGIAHSIFLTEHGSITSKTFQNYYDFILEFSRAELVSKKSSRQLNMRNLRDEITTQCYQKQRSFFVQNLFEPDKLLKVGDLISKMPNEHLLVVLQSHGGVIKDARTGESSYNHRNASYIIFTRYQGPDDPEEVQIGLTWLQEFIQVSKFMDSGETYQNDVDKDMNDYLHRYYGANLRRLVHMKQNWDPKNYFQHPQSLQIL